MIVVDASAVLEVLLQTPAAPRLEARLFAPGETLHAPHLLDLEVIHVLRRYEAAGVSAAPRGQEALDRGFENASNAMPCVNVSISTIASRKVFQSC